MLNYTFKFSIIGKRSTGDVAGEQIMKEKEEKEHRIQVYKFSN